MRRIKRFISDFWPSAIVLAVILYATLASDPVGVDELPPIPYFDKLIHAIMMGGFTGAIAFDIARSRPRQERAEVLRPALMWKIFAAIALFGIADELAQEWLTDARGGEFADYLADLAGSAVAVFIAPPAIRKVLRFS